MKKDKLKGFIEDNKESFDIEESSQDLWSRIEEDLDKADPPKTADRPRLLAIAASLAILIGAGIAFLGEEPPVQLADDVVEEQVEHMATGLEEIDHYYAMQVSEKTAELGNYEVDEDILEELEFLKEEFEELRNDLEVGANPERVIEAMIDNYRLRISILEDLLEALKQERTNQTIGDDEIV